MKPYGREKKVTGSHRSAKIDYHLHPKHLVENWWESRCCYLSRTELKRRWKKQIDKDLSEN